MDSLLPSFVRNLLRSNGDDPYFFQSSRSTMTIDSVFSNPPKEVAPKSGVYELHSPETEPELEVVFFHGFELRDSRDAYWKDWTSSDQSQCWPQTWLVEDFPKARVLSASYDSSLAQGNDSVDLFVLAENLSYGLMQGLIGQSSNCPVIFVGHSVGGLVMKRVCLCLEHSSCRPSGSSSMLNILKNLKGLFFYATPHLGSTLLSQNKARILNGAPPSMAVECMMVDSTSAARSSQEFRMVQNRRGWNLYGVGEMLETELAHGIRGIIVTQESARYGLWGCYFSILADHDKICKPDNKNAIGFQLLTRFISGLLQQSSISTPDVASAAS